MLFTLEPMVNAASHSTILSKFDHWTVTTRDKSLSAQFGHIVGVASDGFEIFTSSSKKTFYTLRMNRKSQFKIVI
jgi:methionyl aminopeptidase